jgi:hypothetical protein
MLSFDLCNAVGTTRLRINDVGRHEAIDPSGGERNFDCFKRRFRAGKNGGMIATEEER